MPVVISLNIKEVAAVHDSYISEKVNEYIGIKPRFLDVGPGKELRLRGIRASGYVPFWRTIDPDQSHGIGKQAGAGGSAQFENKYVYVWEAADKQGNQASLKHELKCKKDTFKNVKKPEHEHDFFREETGSEQSTLSLSVADTKAHFRQRERKHYFFYLSPYQLHPKALGRIGNNVSDIGIYIYDPLHLYVKDNKWTLHLVDPLREAVRRHTKFVEALNSWQEEQRSLNKKDKYVLAKRIQSLVENNEELKDALAMPALNGYLISVEEKSRQRMARATRRALELIVWMGTKQKYDAKQVGGDWIRCGVLLSNGALQYAEEKQGLFRETDWNNWFSSAVRNFKSEEYAQAGANQQDVKEVNLVVAGVNRRLKEIPVGGSWLWRNFSNAVEKKGAIADGGAWTWFEASRKGRDTVKDFVSGVLLEQYAECFARKYQREALDNVKAFMKAKHGIDIEAVAPRSTRRALRSRVRKQRRKAVKRFVHYDRAQPDSVPRRSGGSGKVKDVDLTDPEDVYQRSKMKGYQRFGRVQGLEDPKTQKLKKLDAGLQRVALAMEVVNLSKASWDVYNSEDPWDALNAVGAGTDAYITVSEISRTVQSNNSKIYSKVSSKFGVLDKVKGSPLEMASGTIDTVLATKDWVEASNTGESVGHGMRAAGSAVTVAGAYMGPTLPGAAATVIGLGLQTIGNVVVVQNDDLRIFLRNCEWGAGPGVFDDELDEYWFEGDVRDIKKSTQTQASCIDNLLFHFDPVVKLKTYEDDESIMLEGDTFLKFNSNVKSKTLSYNTKWYIELNLIYEKKRDSFEFKYVDPKNKKKETKKASNSNLEMVDQHDVTCSRDIIIKKFDERPNVLRVKGRVKMDVFGNGKIEIVREVDETLAERTEPPRVGPAL